MIQEQRPAVLRASRGRPIQPDTYDDVDADIKPHSSALRASRETAPTYRFTGIGRRLLWGVAMCLLLAFAGDTLGYAAWTTLSQRLQYGTYPTTQMDARLGHGGISHLTAYTVGNQVMLTEQVGGRLVPYGITSATKLTPPRVVTITIADVNFDGRPDVLLHVDGLAQSIVFDNTGSGLVLALAR